MDSRDRELLRRTLNSARIKSGQSINSVIVISKALATELKEQVKAGRDSVKKVIAKKLRKPNYKNGGKPNGHMPAFLLAPHRIVGPAFLALSILTIVIVSMFAG